MDTAVSPPRPPTIPAERETGRGVRNSAILHVAAIAGFLIYTRVVPPEAMPMIPTLRVDLVGLPDQLKKDLVLPAEPAPEKVEPAPPVAKEPAPEKPKPEEMVLKPKKDAAAERSNAMKNALKRMKALAKVAEENAPIKGNRVSAGSSLDGNAREGEATYYDRLRTRLQENWALPIWLSRQNLSARVQVQIDAVGRLSGFTFVQRSGNAQFDEAVARTLRDSAPFPRPTGPVSVLVGFPL